LVLNLDVTMMTHHDLFFEPSLWQYHNQVAMLLLCNPWYHPTHLPSQLSRRNLLVLFPLPLCLGTCSGVCPPFFLAVHRVCLPCQEFFMIPLILLAMAVIWHSQCKFLLWQVVKYNCPLLLEVFMTLHLAASALQCLLKQLNHCHLNDDINLAMGTMSQTDPSGQIWVH